MSITHTTIQRALRERSRSVMHAITALNEVVAKDHLIAQLAGRLSGPQWQEAEEQLTAQDASLLDAIAEIAAVVEIEPAALRFDELTTPKTTPQTTPPTL